jgi:hypothetical protein
VRAEDLDFLLDSLAGTSTFVVPAVRVCTVQGLGASLARFHLAFPAMLE